ncbi:MAG: hypothetical protein COA32_02640 [Fluviicola sp.]|nr:MAG: hypothetical protein COA32_02640 [Fluviicola sp.]
MRKLIVAFVVLFSVNLTFSQFDSADITAYFTEDIQSVEFDSIINVRKVEIKIANLDSLAIHGVNIEILEANSDYIMSRKIGNKYKAGTMDFVSYANGSYILDIGYFNDEIELKVLVRLEDYQKNLSELTEITLMPYEE